MCCFFASLFFFGPRLAFLVFWLLDSIKVSKALEVFDFSFLAALLGLIFLPWTILVFVIVAPLDSYDWFWLGLGIMADVLSYLGTFQNRRRVPYYPGP
jgi:hypothetical protein